MVGRRSDVPNGCPKFTGQERDTESGQDNFAGLRHWPIGMSTILRAGISTATSGTSHWGTSIHLGIPAFSDSLFAIEHAGNFQEVAFVAEEDTVIRRRSMGGSTSRSCLVLPSPACA
jgi:hypothetical protein